MKVSLNWLKEFIDFKISVKELAEKINLSMVEVEETIDFKKVYKNVVVGEIKEIKKHPHADRLQIAKVSLGKKTIQIIFGTLKLKIGNKLPIAVAPVILPTGLEVERTHIRGVESQGMIASNKDLGLDYSDSEVIFFGEELKTGTPLVRALKIDDIVLNLDVLSNRGDLFSHIGVARDIGAILGKKIKGPEVKFSEDKSKKISDFLEVFTKDRKLSPRYQARVITDVKVKESTIWLKNRLVVLGIRPVNNIVDITNYVMMEMGQPLHAFDYDKLDGNNKRKKIIIRTARTGEKIVTLDGKERKLVKSILTIADSKKPIAIAGVIGGKDTEVDKKTKTIILESANFDWVSIRKASRILGIRTEAIVRFEKGLDPNLTEKAIERALQMISQNSRGKIVSGKIDNNYSKDIHKTVELRLDRLNNFLGQKNSLLGVKKILTSLGMDTLLKGEKIIVNIPTFRMDIKEEVDLIEEVARISGYDKIPTTFAVGEIMPPLKDKTIEVERNAKNILKGIGVTEVYNYSFVGEELLRKFSETTKEYFKLQNPLSLEHAYLRKNLAFSMIDTADFNAKNFDEFSIFEISRVFIQKKSKFPEEERKLAVLTYSKKESFYKLKGILEGLFCELGIKVPVFESNNRNHNSLWHPQRVAYISVKGDRIGKIGEIHPEIIEKFDFKNKLSFCEIDFSKLIKKQKVKTFVSFSKFPKVVLDIAITVDEKLHEADIRKLISKIDTELISDIELFDIYRGRQIETGKKSLAYHITYQSNKKTLTDEEVNAVHSKVIKSLSSKFNAKIRSKK